MAPFGKGEILSKTCFGLQNPYTGEVPKGRRVAEFITKYMFDIGIHYRLYHTISSRKLQENNVKTLTQPYDK